MLARAYGLTADHVSAALAELGSLEQLLTASPATLEKLDIPRAARAFLTNPDEDALAADVAWIEANGAHCIPCASSEYPPLLARAPGAPAALFVLGDPEALRAPQLAMVGSRNPTAGGRDTARNFASYFSRVGLTITSGLALGIDAASHEGALLAKGRTIAVCGSGLDQVYPRQHNALAAQIRERGALVSEFPPRTSPRRENFPRRNRIISGLSLGTLVVEAARHSGSLITAACALEQGREVFAIPGSIHNPQSRGCHQLIRHGAKLVEEAADVLSELNISFDQQSVMSPATAVSVDRGMDKEYQMLLDALGFEPVSIDVLVTRTGLPSESIASMLLILELGGRVAPQAGGRYSRTN